MDGLNLNVDDDVRGAMRPQLSGAHARRRAGWKRRLLSPLSLCVGVPTVLSALYFSAIASPQYVSEVQFVVRGASAQQPSLLSSLLQSSGGGASASEDTYAVQSYMMSRDAAATLNHDQNLARVFGRRGADFLSRYPNIFYRDDFEHFFRYYQKHVEAELDSTTGISALTVRTFDPADSQRVAMALMVAAENLVNRMNHRQRENLIASARQEVTDAQTQLRQVSRQIGDYRNQVSLLDPMKQSTPLLKDIDDLKVMRSTTEMQLTQLKAAAPSSPLIQVYNHRLAALDAQIERRDSAVTGSDGSLVPKITAYEDLVLQRELLEKQLEAAATRLEAAKTQADHQALFLDEVVRPNAPDYAAYPHGIIDTLIVFASCFGLYAIGRLLIAGAREHHIV